MLASEDETVVAEALKRYREITDPETLPAELRSLVLGTVARFGTEEEFQKLVKLHETTQNADYRSDLCAALTSTRDAEKIKQLQVVI